MSRKPLRSAGARSGTAASARRGTESGVGAVDNTANGSAVDETTGSGADQTNDAEDDVGEADERGGGRYECSPSDADDDDDVGEAMHVYADTAAVPRSATGVAAAPLEDNCFSPTRGSFRVVMGAPLSPGNALAFSSAISSVNARVSGGLSRGERKRARGGRGSSASSGGARNGAAPRGALARWDAEAFLDDTYGEGGAGRGGVSGVAGAGPRGGAAASLCGLPTGATGVAFRASPARPGGATRVGGAAGVVGFDWLDAGPEAIFRGLDDELEAKPASGTAASIRRTMPSRRRFVIGGPASHASASEGAASVPRRGTGGDEPGGVDELGEEPLGAKPLDMGACVEGAGMMATARGAAALAQAQAHAARARALRALAPHPRAKRRGVRHPRMLQRSSRRPRRVVDAEVPTRPTTTTHHCRFRSPATARIPSASSCTATASHLVVSASANAIARIARTRRRTRASARRL